MLINHSIIEEIKSIIQRNRGNAIRAVDHERVVMYWNVGRTIFEEEQQGRERAGYGEYLIKYLSARLQPEFGSGFSYTNLNLFKKFYRVFPIVHAVRTQLTWTHYRCIIRIDNQDTKDI